MFLVGKRQMLSILFWIKLGVKLIARKKKFQLAVVKEILLKFILQAQPSYTMGIFLLPKSIQKRLNSLLKNFWWGTNGERSKIHWLDWDKIGMSKNVGGRIQKHGKFQHNPVSQTRLENYSQSSFIG